MDLSAEEQAAVIGEIFGGLNVRAMLPSLEAACEEFCEKVNTRAHRTTRRPPVEMLAEEPDDEMREAAMDLIRKSAAPTT